MHQIRIAEALERRHQQGRVKKAEEFRGKGEDSRTVKDFPEGKIRFSKCQEVLLEEETKFQRQRKIFPRCNRCPESRLRILEGNMRDQVPGRRERICEVKIKTP